MCLLGRSASAEILDRGSNFHRGGGGGGGGGGFVNFT